MCVFVCVREFLGPELQRVMPRSMAKKESIRPQLASKCYVRKSSVTSFDQIARFLSRRWPENLGGGAVNIVVFAAAACIDKQSYLSQFCSRETCECYPLFSISFEGNM